MKSDLLTILILLLSACNMPTEEKNPEDDSRFKAIVQDLKDRDFYGVVMVSESDTISLHKSFGYSEKSSDSKNQLSTVFDIGSITKQFTGAGVSKLVMDGKLSLDDSLGSFFENAPRDKAGISIHSLLTHTSGLVDVVGRDYDPISEEEFINTVFESPLDNPVGSTHSYSNVGYSLLTLIIERASGLPYEEFLNREIFAPVGMKQTGYQLPIWHDIAHGFDGTQELLKPTEEQWGKEGPFLHLKGNGGLLSTSEDLLKWGKAIRNHSVLDPNITSRYLHPHVKEYEDGNSHYGYGWVIDKDRSGAELIWHNGGNGIFFGDMWMVPEDEIIIIVLCNKYEDYTELIAEKLLDIIREE